MKSPVLDSVQNTNQSSNKARVPVKLITNEAEAKLIFDPMRREILRLLSRKAYTQRELAKTLGITAPSVDHHLKTLIRSQLISVVRKRAESHGIVQKWYMADAEAFFVDRDRCRQEIRRYFMPMDIERTRGVVAALSLLRGGITPSTEYIETLTRRICSALTEESRNYSGGMQDDPELTIHSLYVNALKNLEL